MGGSGKEAIDEWERVERTRRRIVLWTRTHNQEVPPDEKQVGRLRSSMVDGVVSASDG
jgi:hypothetical protein